MPFDKPSARLRVFTSWPFLLSLATLLLNDLYLKAAYHNWVTGKLSDFSGLFMVTTLISTLLPSHPRITGLFVASAFSVWKSPLSEPMIKLIQQSLGVIHFGRVVDYSDLFAVTMIPLAIVLSNNPVNTQMTVPMVRRALAVPVAMLALFAIMGTSVATRNQEYIIRAVDEAPCPDQEEVIAAIDKVANAHGLTRSGGVSSRKQSSGEEMTELNYSGGRIRMFCRVDEHGSARFEVWGMPSWLFFVHYPDKEMEKIKKSLMSELGRRFQGMEFVMPLNKK